MYTAARRIASISSTPFASSESSSIMSYTEDSCHTYLAIKIDFRQICTLLTKGDVLLSQVDCPEVWRSFKKTRHAKFNGQVANDLKLNRRKEPLQSIRPEKSHVFASNVHQTNIGILIKPCLTRFCYRKACRRCRKDLASITVIIDREP